MLIRRAMNTIEVDVLIVGSGPVGARMLALLLLSVAAWAPFALAALLSIPAAVAYLGEAIAMSLAYGGLLADECAALLSAFFASRRWAARAARCGSFCCGDESGFIIASGEVGAGEFEVEKDGVAAEAAGIGELDTVGRFCDGERMVVLVTGNLGGEVVAAQ